MRKKSVVLAILLVALVASSLPPASWASANPLSGDFYGSVSVDSPSGVGDIDLAFHLELDSSGNILPAASYILLEKTVLFPRAGAVDEKDVGPFVESGHLTGSSFLLITQSFTTTATRRTVTRQLALTDAAVIQQGNSVTGTYTETMSGYLPGPTKIVGTFVLVRPVPVTEGLPCCVDLDKSGDLSIEEIRAGGKDPTVVEFEDVGCAMRYYRGLAKGPTISQSTMEKAIDEYEQVLRQ